MAKKVTCAACGQPQGTGNLGQDARLYNPSKKNADCQNEPICDACSDHNNLRDCDCAECEALREKRWNEWCEKVRSRRTVRSGGGT